LFGLLAVELAIEIHSPWVRYGSATVMFFVALVFVWRSFYSMRIASAAHPAA
jgi:K(+)-stimulated pyrophosphate-energized sodium pump